MTPETILNKYCELLTDTIFSCKCEITDITAGGNADNRIFDLHNLRNRLKRCETELKDIEAFKELSL